MKYQKKVVQIEAWQLGSKDAPQWVEDAINDKILDAPLLSNHVELVTQRGRVRGYRGDYLILNPDNTLYMCKKSLFEATYEPFVEPVTMSGFDMGEAIEDVPEIAATQDDIASAAEVQED